MNTEPTSQSTHAPVSNTKRWIKRLLIATLVVAAATAGYKALRWNNMDDAQRSTYIQQRIAERTQDRLDLTPTQAVQLQALIANVSVEVAKQNPQDLLAQARNAFSGTTLDRAALQAIALDVTTRLSAQATGPLFTQAADFYDSLTPEQQAIVRKRMDH